MYKQINHNKISLKLWKDSTLKNTCVSLLIFYFIYHQKVWIVFSLRNFFKQASANLAII